MSLNPEQTKLITRKLKQWLENDRQIVNFRQVSREIGCHVDIAKNVLLSHARSNPSLQITYLLSGPLLSTSALAQTQLPSDGLQLDAKALAALEASQRVKIRDMDEVSDGERNSDDGTEGDDELVGNDKGGEGGISGKGHEFLLPEVDSSIEPEQTPRWGVVMAQQSQFETKRGLFEPSGLSVHIYALSPAPITDPAQYLVPNTLLRQYPEYNDVKYGGISGDLSTEGSGSSSKIALKSGAMDFGSGSAASKKPEVGVKKATEKEVKSKAAPGIAKKEGVKVEPAAKGDEEKETKPEIKKATPKAVAKGKAAEPAKATSSATTRKPATQSQSRSKKRIITSDDESEHGSNAATDTADPPTPTETETASKALTSSMVREGDQAAMEAMMDMGMSDGEFEVMDDKPKKPVKKAVIARASATKKAEPDAETGASKSGRKRRVVKKSKTEIDEKGYMVTKDYTSEESYSGDSDAGPSKAKPSAKPRKSAASNSSATIAAKSKPSQSTSRASSVSTEVNDEKDHKKSGSSAAMASSNSVASAGAGNKAKPAPPPPKNVPGKAGKPKGQSTLAGFFTKK